MASNVTGSSPVTPTFSQIPASGILGGTPIPMGAAIALAFRTAGVSADQVDGVHAKDYTFVASTPQSLDLTTLTDVLGTTLVFARLRFIAIQVQWTADVALLVGAAGSNEYNGFLTSSGKISVFPSSSANSGFLVMAAPQTLGISSTIDATHKLIKFDPQTAAGIVRVIIAGCST